MQNIVLTLGQMWRYCQHSYQTIIEKAQYCSGLAPLAFRLILAPVMMVAGLNKLNLTNPDVVGWSRFLADENVIAWFGNVEWGLGLPVPSLLAFLAGWVELLGGVLLLLGLLTRLISIPLMFTMLVAITTVHAEHGWFAIAPSNADTSPARAVAWLGLDSATQSLEQSAAVAERLNRARSILEQHGNTGYLYQYGNLVVLNNGMEFAFTYFSMLLSLFFTGAGRFVSLDWWLNRHASR